MSPNNEHILFIYYGIYSQLTFVWKGFLILSGKWHGSLVPPGPIASKIVTYIASCVYLVT